MLLIEDGLLSANAIMTLDSSNAIRTWLGVGVEERAREVVRRN